MKPGILSLAENPMEDMSHLVEESGDFGVCHERRAVRSGLGEICNHGHERVAALVVGKVETGQQIKDGGMRIFVVCVRKCVSRWRGAASMRLTTGEKIKVNMTNEARLIRGILLPDRELLNI